MTPRSKVVQPKQRRSASAPPHPDGGSAIRTPPPASDGRAPHVAELVAEELRRRILDGDIADGEVLSTLDSLRSEFATSPPSMREALRILETEGLVSVRRGRNGGAVVH